MSNDCQYLGGADSATSERLGSRAMSAYWRGVKDGETLDQPTEPELYQSSGNYYVVLRNIHGILAMYRLKNDGVLRRLKRYPRCIVEAIEG